MNTYFFEIVERPYGRYSWILVTYRKNRRRMLAGANRDYRSPAKARAAVDKLKDVVAGAVVVDTFPPNPDYSFQVLTDVLPLSAGSPDGRTERRPERPRTTATAARRRSVSAAPAAAEPAAIEASAPAAEPAGAAPGTRAPVRKRQPATTRTPRARTTTTTPARAAKAAARG